MNKLILLIVILAIIIIALVGFLFWPTPKQPMVINQQPPADIEIFNIKAGDSISSPLKIIGIVRGNGWTGFEGQVGQVVLTDSNGKWLGRAVLNAITEWTTLPTNFEANLEFTTPDTLTGYLNFENENPSGMQGKYKNITIPVNFK